MTRFKRLSLALAAAVGIGLLPPVQARGKAFAVLADALGAPLPRPFARPAERVEVRLGGVTGDLYEPTEGAPAILLIPGAAPKGKDDPRAVRLARSLARSNRTVFVPTLRLSSMRLERADIEGLVDAIGALARRTDRPVVVLGISYGGSLGMIAAADQRVRTDIELVAVFGAFFDLRGLIQAASTGVSLVGERRVPWGGDPRAGEVLREAALELVPRPQRDVLAAAFDRRDQGIPEDLPPEARSVYELVVNRDPRQTAALAARLGAHASKVIRDFSPSTFADQIASPVVAIHSTDDPVTPYGEAVRLKAALPDARLVTVSLFEHVDVDGLSPRALPDLIRTWRFTSWVLEAQE